MNYMLSFEEEDEIRKLQIEIATKRAEQRKLKGVEQGTMHAGFDLEADIPYKKDYLYDKYSDKGKYDQLEQEIRAAEERIAYIQGGPARMQKEKDLAFEDEQEKRRQAWKRARARYDELSGFKKAVLRLTGKDIGSYTGLKKHKTPTAEIDNLYARKKYDGVSRFKKAVSKLTGKNIDSKKQMELVNKL